MAETKESKTAARLRIIAAQVKQWEQRDYEEAKALDPDKVMRSTYHHDLEELAAMLEGKHARHKLTARAAGPGNKGGREKLERDLDVCEFIRAQKDDGLKTQEAKKKAQEHFTMSENLVDAVWQKYKYVERSTPVYGLLILGAEGMAKVKSLKRDS